MTPGGDWCPIKTVHCNYCGGIPPVAAQRCWRVETIAGLTGLLQRTLQNIKNTMLVLVIICTIIIRTLQSIKSVIITILTCRSRPSCCWWAWKEAGGRWEACMTIGFNNNVPVCIHYDTLLYLSSMGMHFLYIFQRNLQNWSIEAADTITT